MEITKNRQKNELRWATHVVVAYCMWMLLWIPCVAAQPRIVQMGPVPQESVCMKYVGLLLLTFSGVLLLVFCFSIRSWEQLRQYAFTDLLTKCANFNCFQLEAKRLTKNSAENWAVLDLDVTRFKLINDMYGFEAGDKVLQHISQSIRSTLRKREIYCRIAADDFAVLIHYRDPAELCARTQEILEIAMQPPPDKRDISYRVRGGIYQMTESALNIQSAVDRANLALRTIKDNHLIQYAFYTERMRECVLYEKEIEGRMEDALNKREFVIYYQPKYGLDTGRIVGAEALVRWRRQDGKLIPPDRFIPVFERNGFIRKLDLYVFEVVCKDLKRWQEQGEYPVPVSVNLSRVHLYNLKFYVEYLEIMKLYGIPPYLIELELTENAIFDNREQLIEIMQVLHEQGFLLSIDDFGTGYSSLNLLKDIPIDILKIDREFLSEAVDTGRGKSIVANIVHMARELSIMVVSEGVETQVQAEFLRSIHCDVAQGFFYSRPLPVEQYEKLAFPIKQHNM